MAHEAGCDREEMQPGVPVAILNRMNSEIDFLDEGGRRRRVRRVLTSEVVSRDTAQVPVQALRDVFEGS